MKSSVPTIRIIYTSWKKIKDKERMYSCRGFNLCCFCGRKNAASYPCKEKERARWEIWWSPSYLLSFISNGDRFVRHVNEKGHQPRFTNDRPQFRELIPTSWLPISHFLAENVSIRDNSFQTPTFYSFSRISRELDSPTERILIAR